MCVHVCISINSSAIKSHIYLPSFPQKNTGIFLYLLDFGGDAKNAFGCEICHMTGSCGTESRCSQDASTFQVLFSYTGARNTKSLVMKRAVLKVILNHMVVQGQEREGGTGEMCMWRGGCLFIMCKMTMKHSLLLGNAIYSEIINKKNRI